MLRRPTQQDVAARAGVSRATVSYVLSPREGQRRLVAEETRVRVLKASAELGYQPNVLAQGLKAGRSQTICLLIPDIENPYYLQMLQAAEEVAFDEGYHLVVISSGLNPERETYSLRSAQQYRFDGLILLPTYRADSSIPEPAPAAVGTARVYVGKAPGCDSVAPDTGPGAHELMDHILALGHRRVGIIDGVVMSGAADDRVNIYVSRLREAGGGVAPERVRHVGPTTADGYRAALELLDQPERPTAILAINDVLAVGALHALHERGLRVPEDISLAGFDDIPVAAYLCPPLTTVAQHGRDLGRRAARMLLERMAHPSRPPVVECVEAKLVERRSTGSVPIV